VDGWNIIVRGKRVTRVAINYSERRQYSKLTRPVWDRLAPIVAAFRNALMMRGIAKCTETET
jgi:hypothetical protein